MGNNARRDKWSRIALIVAGILLVSAGHYLIPPSLFLWHNIFQRLYYLPIVFAALSFGWVGGLSAAVSSAVCYIPHIILMWHGNPNYSVNQYAEILVFFLVGVVTGILADRERSQTAELRRTAEQLREANRELQDSFEQLKRADRLSAVGQLAAGLAHEIRNPLASIEGAVDILERGADSGETRTEFLAIIKKESRRLNGLLTNLLDFARPRQPRIREVNVRDVIDSVVDLTTHTAGRGGIRLQVETPEEVPPIEGDAEQLQQVILNLTLNAIQAMPEGGRITLHAHRRGDSLAIHVADEGGGIEADEIDKVFDPFYTTKRSGTGWGLSVAHQIVARHGGTIEVKPNPEKGMSFTVLLPLATRQPRD